MDNNSPVVQAMALLNQTPQAPSPGAVGAALQNSNPQMVAGAVPLHYLPTYNPQTGKSLYPGNMAIEHSPSLSPQMAQIERKFAYYLESNPQKAMQDYAKLKDSQGGHVLNTDVARDLSPEYAQDRSRSAAVHEPASALIKQMFIQKLKSSDKNHDGVVMFTAGGTGAGKSTAINDVPETSRLYKKADFIYDTNMAKFGSAKDKIDAVLASGKKVSIVYVHRDPVEALKYGALPRADRMGRTVPLEEHLNTHLGAPTTINTLIAHYGDKNPNVQFRFIDNSHGKGGAVLQPLDKLKDISYNKDELWNNLKQTLNDEYSNENISEKTYQGFAGQG